MTDKTIVNIDNSTTLNRLSSFYENCIIQIREDERISINGSLQNKSGSVVISDSEINIENSNVIIGSVFNFHAPVTIFENQLSPTETKERVLNEVFKNLDLYNDASDEEDSESQVTLSGILKIIPRIEWVAQPPIRPIQKLHLPAQYIIIQQTATKSCSTQADCVYQIRFIQVYHIESNKWSDISYNFIVGGDGYAYEARGWSHEGCHTPGYDDRSIGIAFLGTFTHASPPRRQVLAAKQLIALGIEKGFISRNYKVLMHCQIKNTYSPEVKLYEEIQTWPHWSAVP